MRPLILSDGNIKMKNHKSWYDQDQFWELIEPFLFTEQRQIDAKDEVKNLIKLLKIKKNDRILDLCCGIGRHSIELACQGFGVIGVDRTSDYIKKARQEAEQKKSYVQELDCTKVVCFGNGNNDRLMLEVAALGIVVMITEGCSSATVAAADIMVRDIIDGINLLFQPTRIKATLRY